MKGYTRATFGEVAIGEAFYWRNAPEMTHGPEELNTTRPMTKTNEKRYDWPQGYGFAEPHYTVWQALKRQPRRPDLPRRQRDRLKGSEG